MVMVGLDDTDIYKKKKKKIILKKIVLSLMGTAKPSTWLFLAW